MSAERKEKFTPGKMNAVYTRLNIGRQMIALVCSQIPDNPERELADAERIALCWNSHDALYEALEAWESAFKAYAPIRIEGGLPVEMSLGRAITLSIAALAAARNEERKTEDGE
jgi:hypothetical protein